MEVIYKYPFEVSGCVDLELPDEAKILKVDCQGDTPCIWALVNTDNKPEKRRFRIFGTGHEIKDQVYREYIATFFQGPFVWHLFEVED